MTSIIGCGYIHQFGGAFISEFLVSMIALFKNAILPEDFYALLFKKYFYGLFL